MTFDKAREMGVPQTEELYRLDREKDVEGVRLLLLRGMDLDTMRDKAAAGAYKSLQELEQDCSLLLHNICILYGGNHTTRYYYYY